MKKTLLILVAAVAVACTYPFTPDLPGACERQLVVEGNICIGETSVFRIGAVQPLSDGPFVNLQGEGIVRAELAVEDDAGVRYPVTASGPTTFLVRTESANVDRQYKLTIKVLWQNPADGDALPEGGSQTVEEQYESPWLSVYQAPKIGEIRFSAEDRVMNVRISMEPADPGNPYYFVEFDENWETHSQYTPGYGFDPETQGYYSLDGWTNPNYYCWHAASSKEAVLLSAEQLAVNRLENRPFHSVSRTDTRLQVLYAIRVRTRGVSPEGFRYFKAVAAGSNLTGDLFTPMPDRTVGNLSCVSDPSRTVIGFVEAVTTASKRAFIDSRYYREALPDQQMVPVLDEDYTLLDHYNLGYRPLYPGTDMNHNTGMLWCPLSCIDCVVAGGTKDKPDYWPNNHE